MNYSSSKMTSSQVKLTMPNENWFSLIFHDFKLAEKQFLIGTISLLLLSFILYTVVSDKSPNASNIAKPQTTISSLNAQHLKFVDELLRGQFKHGTWRYTESELSNNIIKSYIQIPLKLEMEKSYQRNYIKKALCPNKEHSLWKHIRGNQLELHLYTGYKHNSVYAKCG